jgi:hypothetical protein
MKIYFAKHQALASLLFVLIATLISIWGLNLIPIQKLPITPFWRVIIFRFVSAVVAILALASVNPHALKRFGFRFNLKKMMIGLSLVLVMSSAGIIQTSYKDFSPSMIFEGFIFSLFIGIDEDFFSRGLIYGVLEKHGRYIAAGLSSVHFGLLHLGNVIWGGQSLAYTSGQVIEAASFGFLACGLMLFTGSIWVPILLHGLTDFPMQFESQLTYVKEVTGMTDWTGTLINFLINLTIGSLLIHFSQEERSGVLETFLKKANLIE